MLARRLGTALGLPVIELDAVFWQADLTPASAAEWPGIQAALVRGESWVIDGDLGPYDSALPARLAAADTVVVLDFSLWRCVWRALHRAPERWDFWRWVIGYRRRALPRIEAVLAGLPTVSVVRLRSPRQLQRWLDDLTAPA